MSSLFSKKWQKWEPAQASASYGHVLCSPSNSQDTGPIHLAGCDRGIEVNITCSLRQVFVHSLCKHDI